MLSLYFVSRISLLPLLCCKISFFLRFAFRIKFSFLLPCACRKANIFIAMAGDICSSVRCEKPFIFGLLFFVSPATSPLRMSDFQLPEWTGGRESAWGSCDVDWDWILHAKNYPATLEKNHSRSFTVLESLPFSTAKSCTGGDGIVNKCVLQLRGDFEILFMFWKIAV